MQVLHTVLLRQLDNMKIIYTGCLVLICVFCHFIGSLISPFVLGRKSPNFEDLVFRYECISSEILSFLSMVEREI